MSERVIIERENFDMHWGFASFKDKVILDLGADWGGTAHYFLRHGAKKVIAVEGDKATAQELFTNYGNDPNVVCIEKMVVSAKDFEDLISTYKPDLVKVDIEGREDCLPEVSETIICSVKEWLVEPHSEECHEKLRKLFTSLGYQVEIQGEPKVVWATLTHEASCEVKDKMIATGHHLNVFEEKVAVIIPVNNEEQRIKDCIAQFKGYVDEVIVIYDNSTDKTHEIAEQCADKVVRFPENLSEPHQSKIYNFGVRQTDAEWVLNPDCDERYTKVFLENIRNYVQFARKHDFYAYRFRRFNLVTEEELKRLPKERLTKTGYGWVKDYPDYQVRLVFRPIIEWLVEPHSVAYHKYENIPIDKEGKGWCRTISNGAHITHLPRRGDLKRSWW